MLAYLFLALAVLFRFVPHFWNFTLVGAALLFFGANRPRRELWIAILALAASDIVLTRYINAFPLTLETFASSLYYLIALLIGGWLRGRTEIPRVIGASLAGSILFFVLSNFATWVSYNMYPHTAAGLMTCYVAAIPFFRNTLASDLVFSLVMFGTPMLLAALERKRALVAAR